MENLQIILSIASAALGLLITSVTFLAGFLKNANAKKVAENIVKIGEAVLPYIKQAESFNDYSGKEKKEFVMTKANQFAIENNIAFDSIAVSERIEELICLTKSVNAKKTEGI